MKRVVGIRSVTRGSAAYVAGARAGDLVTKVNGEVVYDELDCSFLAADSQVDLVLVRDGVQKEVSFARDDGSYLGIVFETTPVARCRNKCVFCFVDQLPAGLRSTLYVKDEDYRHSFLYGNYVTLTGQKNEDLDHIAAMGYSPLYVSVHATDPAVRLRLLGVKRAPDILEQLGRLSRSGVSFHTQLVLCPGINDGSQLERSLKDLLGLGESLLSVALVPVGLTRYRSGISPVGAAEAQAMIAISKSFGDRDQELCGTRRVFCADELFIKAGQPIPPRSYYGAFPQIENGVGLVRTLLDDWARIRKGLLKSAGAPGASATKKGTLITVLTSVSALPFLRKVVESMVGMAPWCRAEVCAVENQLLGQSVTVAGLLGGQDIARAIVALSPQPAVVILPSIMFNAQGHTLDGWSVGRIEKKSGVRVVCAANAAELWDVLRVRKKGS